MTTLENTKPGFLKEASNDIAADNKSKALLELTSLINPDQYIGDLLSLDYDSADILIHDSHKTRVNGVPHGCLLIASRITPDDPPITDLMDSRASLLLDRCGHHVDYRPTSG